MKYECHGCGKIHDDNKGMPVRCCGKIIRHKYIKPKEIQKNVKREQNNLSHFIVK